VTGTPGLSFVVPAHRSEATLGPCLAAIAAQARGGDEVLVVAERPSVEEEGLAVAHGARLVRADSAWPGAADARNTGARLACRPWLVFVDADVEVSPGAVDRLRELIASGRADAVVGSFVAAANHRLLSTLKNCQVAFHHHRNEGFGPGFASALAAVRRDAYLATGGMDVRLRYCDDIELGHRMAREGCRILMAPAVTGRHLKEYDLRSWVRSEVQGRARPWTALILRRRVAMGSMNTRPGELLAGLCAAAIPALLALGVLWRPGLAAAAAALALFGLVQPAFVVFVGRAGGAAAVLGAVPFLLGHYWCAAAGSAWAVLDVVGSGRRAA
jgi:GT2 family glycosyltransferase